MCVIETAIVTCSEHVIAFLPLLVHSYCIPVPTTAGKLQPCHVWTFASPKEGLTALSFVSLLIPIFIRENQDWNLENRTVLALSPAAKSMVSKAHGKEVYSNRAFIYIYISS